MTTAGPYGIDLSCREDIDPRMVEVDGLEQLAEAMLRRLDTQLATLLDDEDGTYGYAICELVSRGMTTDERASVAGQVRAQFLDDDRIQDALVVLVPTTPDRLELECKLTTARGSGSFRLSIDKVKAAILNVREDV